jgi:hypothetical protein
MQTLDEFMGVDADAEQQGFLDLQARIGELTVECMSDQGLEYAVREGDPGSRPPLGEGLSDDDFMLRYGYGVFTGVLDEARWNTEYPPEEQGADPDTLYGEFTDDVEAYMVVLDECTDQIERDLGRPEPGVREALVASIDEAWSPLESELEGVQRLIEGDSRLAEVEEAWSACMSDKGYDFDTDEDIESHLEAKLDDFEASINTGTLVLTTDLERDIQPLIDEELAIAAADLVCRPELDRIRLELQRQYEGLFIDEHRAQLEEIRALEQQLMEIFVEGWQW